MDNVVLFELIIKYSVEVEYFDNVLEVFSNVFWSVIFINLGVILVSFL